MGEGDAQYSQLAGWVAEWQRRPTDSPRSSGETLLWIDRACLPPGNVSVGLTCLPIFVAGSRRLLVLAGSTYSSRLWCAMELWMFVQMGDAANIDVRMVVNENEQASDVQRSLSHFDASKAQCLLEDDRHRLLGAIEASFGTSGPFNTLVRKLFAERLDVGETIL